MCARVRVSHVRTDVINVEGREAEKPRLPMAMPNWTQVVEWSQTETPQRESPLNSGGSLCCTLRALPVTAAGSASGAHGAGATLEVL